MRYSGIQPQYFPRLHYFARILASDVYVIRDDAQFVRKHKYPGNRIDKSYQADSPIKDSKGRFLLRLPIQHEGFLPLAKTRISYNFPWGKDHLQALMISYAKAQNFRETYKEIAEVLVKKYTTLADLNIATICWGMLRLLGDGKPARAISLNGLNRILRKQKMFRLREVRRASQSQVLSSATNLTPNEKIVRLIQEVGANEDYCGGTGVAAYVDHRLFREQGITITVQDWKCRDYPQLFMKQQGFIPDLSIIDLLMNVSRPEAANIIKG